MKLCYVDESGNNDSDPCFVMVAIHLDATKLNRTRTEFGKAFDEIQKLFQENLRELKGSKIIFGKDRWRKVDPEIRKRIVGFFCEWILDKGKIVLSAIDRAKFETTKNESGSPELSKDLWIAAAMHVALQVQKMNQVHKANKGNTFLVFDENKVMADALSELLWNPPEWTESFYGKKKRAQPLSQIIDTAFTVKSHHAGLVQVADLFAFIFRRYVELLADGAKEQWDGEKVLIENYVWKLSNALSPRALRWPKSTSSLCAKWYNKIAPAGLLDLR